MPKGPRGEKRPADAIGAAVKVMRIATGEEADERETTASAAAQLGKLGGAARAKKLTAEQRAEIAKLGAKARWASGAPRGTDEEMPRATHQGSMTVGTLDLDCYVLEDGRRVFHKRGMAKALGMKSGGGNVFLRAMQRKGLGSELSQNLVERLNNPIIFKPLTQDLAHGYEAEDLVDICKAIITRNFKLRHYPVLLGLATTSTSA